MQKQPTTEKKSKLDSKELGFLLQNLDTLTDAQLRTLKDQLDTTVDAVQKENCQDIADARCLKISLARLVR